MTNKDSLLIIDPQNDFCDLPNSRLPVEGATKDLNTLIRFIKTNQLQDIIVTLDTHSILDIAHPSFWKNEYGMSPQPFTVITREDILEAVWQPYDDKLKDYCVKYAGYLEEQGKYSLIIWPEHCINNSWGWQVYAPLKKAIEKWERLNNKKAIYIRKGMNPLTEHYSAVKAEVAIKKDLHTLENKELISCLSMADNIFVGGEALTHCVYSTVKDIIEVFKRDKIETKITLLSNASSPVSGFEDKVESINEELVNQGVVISNII